MNANLSRRMELAFWDMIIYMLSESPWARRMVRSIYSIMPKESLQDSMKLLAMLALLGFASGILFYLAAQNLL